MPGRFFDTNVLLYLLSSDGTKADAAEASIADENESLAAERQPRALPRRRAEQLRRVLLLVAAVGLGLSFVSVTVGGTAA